MLTRVSGLCAVPLLCLALQAAEVRSSVAAKNIHTEHFMSESLGEERNFNLLLPSDYESSTRRYPTLYLLHGYGDDHTAWSYMTNLSNYGTHHDIIIVMPDASRSWYVNSAADPKAKFEDYIVKDLVEYTDSHFRTIPLPRARAIAGLSMGGYGATFLGLKHFNEFAALGTFSGAVAFAHEPPPVVERTPEGQKRMQDMQALFGKDDAERKERDPFALLDKVPAAQMPRIYIACGGEDFLIKQNREFVQYLADRKVPYEYRRSRRACTRGISGTTKFGSFLTFSIRCLDSSSTDL